MTKKNTKTTTKTAAPAPPTKTEESVDAVRRAANMIDTSAGFVLEEAVEMYQALRALEGLGHGTEGGTEEIVAILNRSSRHLGDLLLEVGVLQKIAAQLAGRAVSE